MHLWRNRRAWLALALALLPAALPAQSGTSEPAAIDLLADDSEIDRRSGKVVLRNVRISRADASVRADRAEATDLDFEATSIELTGRVRLDTDSASVSAARLVLEFRDRELESARFFGDPVVLESRGRDATRVSARSARVEVRNGRVRNAELQGNPVVIQQPLGPDGNPASARAGRVDYQVDDALLSLSDDAWLREGANEISGETIVYDIARQRVTADSGDDGSQRVRITINPDAPDTGEPDDEVDPDP